MRRTETSGERIDEVLSILRQRGLKPEIVDCVQSFTARPPLSMDWRAVLGETPVATYGELELKINQLVPSETWDLFAYLQVTGFSDLGRIAYPPNANGAMIGNIRNQEQELHVDRPNVVITQVPYSSSGRNWTNAFVMRENFFRALRKLLFEILVYSVDSRYPKVYADWALRLQRGRFKDLADVAAQERWAAEDIGMAEQSPKTLWRSVQDVSQGDLYRYFYLGPVVGAPKDHLTLGINATLRNRGVIQLASSHRPGDTLMYRNNLLGYGTLGDGWEQFDDPFNVPPDGVLHGTQPVNGGGVSDADNRLDFVFFERNRMTGRLETEKEPILGGNEDWDD